MTKQYVPFQSLMMKNFSEALVTRVSRSSDCGRGLDLSSSAMAVLNWEVYDDVRGSNILLFE